MDDNAYNLIVNSINIRRENIAAVREQMCSLFQLQQDQLDKLFSDKPLRIIKNINYSKAQYYRDAIIKAGMECRIESITVIQKTPP